jgi:antitoxin MazE
MYLHSRLEILEVGNVRAQIMKWGNSLAVRIPKAIAEEAKLKAGDPLDIEVAEPGCVRLQRPGKIPSLDELVSQITPENRYPEIPIGPELGKESVEW